jgi:hypothetical protein
MQKVKISVRESCVEVDNVFEIYDKQKVKILVRESCVEVVKIDFLLQKMEISVRESCVEVHKFARLTQTQKGLRPPPLFLTIHITYYTAPR